MKAATTTATAVMKIEDRPLPDLDPHRVLVDIEFVGICGSDVHYFQAGRNGAYQIREPLVLGHEAVGRVRAIGSAVTDALAVGDPVAIHPAFPSPVLDEPAERGLNLYRNGTYLGSASTRPHTQGALTEVVSLDPRQLRPLPATLPLRRAVLAEPLSIALHGVDRAGPSLPGASVLVSGAGPIGCLVITALRERGVASITALDFHVRALELALACGADTAIRIGEDTTPEPETFDVVIEAAGALPSLAAAIGYVRRGGVIVQLGILPAGDLAAPLAEIVSKELTLLGSQRFDIEMTEAVRMLDAHPELDLIITDEFPLDGAEQAILAAADAVASTKVVIHVQHLEGTDER